MVIFYSDVSLPEGIIWVFSVFFLVTLSDPTCGVLWTRDGIFSGPTWLRSIQVCKKRAWPGVVLNLYQVKFRRVLNLNIYIYIHIYIYMHFIGKNPCDISMSMDVQHPRTSNFKNIPEISKWRAIHTPCGATWGHGHRSNRTRAIQLLSTNRILKVIIAIWTLGIIKSLAGWCLTYPSEKYDFVSWDYCSQYMESHKKLCSKPPTSNI